MRYLIGGAALLLVGLAAAFVVHRALLDEERLERRIGAVVLAWTGQALDVTGGADLKLLPQPVLTLHRPRLGTPADGLVLAVDRLDLDLAFWPLLAGSVQVIEANLVRPELRLGGDPDAALDGLANRLAAHGSALPIRRLRVIGGTLAALTGEALLRDLDGVIEREGAIGSSRIQATARLASPGPATRLELEGQLGSAAAGRPLPLQLRLEAPIEAGAHRLTFRGQFRPARATRGLAGRLTVELPASPRALLTELVSVWPELERLPVPDAPLTLAGDLALELGDGPPSLRLDQAALGLAGQALTGRLALDGGATPVIDLVLEADRLAITEDRAGLAPFARQVVQALPPALVGEVELRAALVEWRGQAFRQVALDLALEGAGAVEIARATVVLPGPGDLAFTGRLQHLSDAAGSNLTGRLEAALQNPGELAAALAPPPAIVERSATLALSTDLDWQPSGLTLQNTDLRLDVLHAAGSLAYRHAEADGLPQLAVLAAVDRLALDDLVDAAEPAAVLNNLLDVASGFDLALDLRISRTSLADARFGSLTARLDSSDGAVVIERLSLNDIAGSAVALTGQVHAPSRGFDLELAVDVASLSRLLRLAGVEPPATLALMGPLNLRGGLAGDLDRAQLTAALDADLFRAEAAASVADWLVAPTGPVTLRIDAGEASTMLRQLAGVAVTDPLLEGPLAAELAVELAAGDLRAAGLELAAGELALGLDAARAGANQGPLDRFALRFGPLSSTTAAFLYQLLTPPLDLVPGPPARWLGYWPPQTLTWDWLHGHEAELAVTLGGADLDLPSLTFNSQLRDGTLTIPALRWVGEAGAIDAGMALAARADGSGADLSLDLSLERFAADVVLAALGAGPAALHGSLDLEARLRTHGASVRALVGNLEGVLDLVLTEGVMGAAPPALGGIPVDRLTAALAVERGVLGPGDAGIAFSGPDGAGRIEGYADLLAWMVDLELALDSHDGIPLARHRLFGPLGEPRLVDRTSDIEEVLPEAVD